MIRYIAFAVAFCATAFAFPNHSFESSTNTPLTQPTVIEGCVGDCASCHSLYPYEAKQILGKKFDVKEIISIAVKRGYFEVIYKDSKGKKEKINLLFSKDKACKELILLGEE